MDRALSHNPALFRASGLMMAAAFLSLLLLSVAAEASSVPPGTEKEIQQRLSPRGKVCMIGTPCAADVPSTSAANQGEQMQLSGGDIYQSYCVACHATGVAGAPTLGDQMVWKERYAQGIEALYASTIDGKGAMPAKGTCVTCQDEDLHEAVDYMLGEAGLP